jgi:hypothetical protein
MTWEKMANLFEKNRVIQLALMDKFGISIELVAAIAGDGSGMIVNVRFEELLVQAKARYGGGTRTIISPMFLLLDLLNELAYYELLLLLLRHSSASEGGTDARKGIRGVIFG